MNSASDLQVTQKVRRPRVLLIVEACNPEWASVPLVGFNLYNALQEVADITLVTQIRNRDALLDRAPQTARIEFVDTERIAAPVSRLGHWLTLGKGLGWTTKQALNLVPYLYFEHLVFKRFRASLARGEYDIVHRVTPLTPTYPSPIASWTDTPFILGPINGGLPWPKGTGRIRLGEMEWLSYFRPAYHMLPYIRNTYARAAFLIAGSRYTLSSLPRRCQSRAVYIPENAIDPTAFSARGRESPERIAPFQILFVGRLAPLKGVDTLVQAVAGSPLLRRRAKVRIAGSGPEEQKLLSLVKQHGLEKTVRFMGWIPHGQISQCYRESSVFVLPSLKEFGGAVVLEAMACGLPSVVADYGGPAEFITEKTGVKIPVADHSTMVHALRATLERLYCNPALLRAMSQAGVDQANALHTWKAKASQIARLYASVLTSRTC